MLRLSAIGCLDHRPRGQSKAAVLAVLVVLSGCSSTSGSGDPTVDTPWTSRFTSVFSGPAAPAAQAAPAAPVPASGDCPSIDVRTGAGTYTASGSSADTTAGGVRYQASLSQLARQCTVAGGNLLIKVGVQGRIILGPAGAPGPVDLPLRFAIVQDGLTPRTIATKFKHVGAEVPPGQSNVAFSDVDESLSVPMPSRAELAGYMIYVGFDEIGDEAEKKPAAKKPAAKRKATPG
jgi:hypothetical protein